jgi:hypothetical protein
MDLPVFAKRENVQRTTMKYKVHAIQFESNKKQNHLQQLLACQQYNTTNKKNKKSTEKAKKNGTPLIINHQLLPLI